MTAMRINKATNATPPTTPPAMAPGLTWLDADTAVLCGCAAEVADVDVDDWDGRADDWGGGRVGEDVDVALVVRLVLTEEEDRNGAAMAGFESRNPAVKSPVGQPLVHGLDLQQPMKGGSVKAQVYHRLPWGHC